MLLAKAQAYGLEIGDFERAHPDLLHGPVAAKMAEEEFAIHDPDILGSDCIPYDRQSGHGNAGPDHLFGRFH